MIDFLVSFHPKSVSTSKSNESIHLLQFATGSDSDGDDTANSDDPNNPESGSPGIHVSVFFMCSIIF